MRQEDKEWLKKVTIPGSVIDSERESVDVSDVVKKLEEIKEQMEKLVLDVIKLHNKNNESLLEIRKLKEENVALRADATTTDVELLMQKTYLELDNVLYKELLRCILKNNGKLSEEIEERFHEQIDQ